MRRRRVVVVFVVLCVCFVTVLARLVRLQLVEHPLWSRESAKSAARFRSLPFERGWIFDRNGEPLARTEEVADLAFRYRDWRRGTAAGQAGHAWWTLGAERPDVSTALAHVDELTDALGDVTVAQIATLEPRQRRRDLGFYVERLLGRDFWDEVERLLVEEPEPAADALRGLPGFEAACAAARRRADWEWLALVDLARVVDVSFEELRARMDEALVRADRRVASALTEEDDYARRQQVRAEFDDDPSTIASRVPYDTATLVALRGGDLDGFDVAIEQRRVYPPAVADVAPLVVGRVGAPRPTDIRLSQERRVRLANLASLRDLTAQELDEYLRLRIQVREVDYAHGDERGVLGVEAALEEVLRGKRGWVATSLDGERTVVERQAPRRGSNVTLTLDADLQRACQEVLDDVGERALLPEDAPAGLPERCTGAIVLLEVETGAVLAAASSPRPTREALTSSYGKLLTADPLVRLRHRALDPGASGNLPPPGSTFKPVAALAGLDAGVIGATTTFHCERELDVGDRTMGCLGHHGDIDVVEAISRSCNIFFYHLGAAAGADVLRTAAQAFGYGRRSGLLLGNASLDAMGVPVGSGLHESRPRLGPPPDSRTDAMRLAIGQAPLDDVTPLQVACMMAAVGTGELRQPSLVASVEGFGDVPPCAARPVGYGEAQLAVVRRGMEAVIDAGSGHALRDVVAARHPWLVGAVAAKTGTAQVGGGLDHSWFVGYLPRRDPRLAFAVLVEDCGLHGNEAALPVFIALLSKPAVADLLRHEVMGQPREGATTR